MCAKLLGYLIVSTDRDFCFAEKKSEKKSSIPLLLELNFETRFCSSWTWIHEVTEAINKTSNPKSSQDTTHSSLKRGIQIFLGMSNKERTIGAINEFLTWYDKQHDTTRNTRLQ